MRDIGPAEILTFGDLTITCGEVSSPTAKETLVNIPIDCNDQWSRLPLFFDVVKGKVVHFRIDNEGSTKIDYDCQVSMGGKLERDQSGTLGTSSYYYLDFSTDAAQVRCDVVVKVKTAAAGATGKVRVSATQ